MSVESELQELKVTVQHLKDRQDILDCIVRESRGRDRHDVELSASCYWPEGADEHGAVPIAARDYPDSAKVPDALLNIGSAQSELGDNAAARKTLEELIARHPQSEAAAKAKQRLGMR